MKEEVCRIEVLKSATMGWVINVERVAVGVNESGPFLAGVTTTVTYTASSAEDVAALVRGVVK